jgi:hypothetical protein
MTLSPKSADGQISEVSSKYIFPTIIGRICLFEWNRINRQELMRVAQVYYYFSVQFRENLGIACALFPCDAKLRRLQAEECNTDNLSPWPRVAAIGEKLNHDEFMRRALRLDLETRSYELDRIGGRYLSEVRAFDQLSRAKSIASYEAGGLSRVFSSILQARDWRGPGLGAFKFFLEKHIEFDSDDGAGHGALARHLQADDSILPLWVAFHDLLLAAAPGLAPTGFGASSVELWLGNWFSSGPVLAQR